MVYATVYKTVSLCFSCLSLNKEYKQFTNYSNNRGNLQDLSHGKNNRCQWRKQLKNIEMLKRKTQGLWIFKLRKKSIHLYNILLEINVLTCNAAFAPNHEIQGRLFMRLARDSDRLLKFSKHIHTFSVLSTLK